MVEQHHSISTQRLIPAIQVAVVGSQMDVNQLILSYSLDIPGASRLPMWYNTLLQLDCGVFKHPMSLALPVLLSGWLLKNVSLTLKPIAALSPHCNSGQLYVNTA